MNSVKIAMVIMCTLSLHAEESCQDRLVRSVDDRIRELSDSDSEITPLYSIITTPQNLVLDVIGWDDYKRHLTDVEEISYLQTSTDDAFLLKKGIIVYYHVFGKCKTYEIGKLFGHKNVPGLRIYELTLVERVISSGMSHFYSLRGDIEILDGEWKGLQRAEDLIATELLVPMFLSGRPY